MILNTNNPMTKTKASAFKALMGNKELSQSLFDSWNAPIGSTKRTKAKSVLKSVLMTSQRNAGIPDGEGGPGAMPGMYSPYGQQGAAQPQGSSSAPQQPQQSSNGMSSAYDMYTPYGSNPQAATTPTPKPTATEPPAPVPGQPMPPKQIKFMKTIDHLVNQKAGLNQGVTPSGAFGTIKNIFGNLPESSSSSRAAGAYNWLRDKAQDIPDIKGLAKEEATGWGKFFGNTALEAAKYPFKSVAHGAKWLGAEKEDAPSGLFAKFNLPGLDSPFANWFANKGLGDEAVVNNNPVAVIKDPETGEVKLEDAYEEKGIEGSTDAEGNLITGTGANTEGNQSIGAGVNTEGGTSSGSGIANLSPEEISELEGANYNTINNMDEAERNAWYSSLDSQSQAKVSPLIEAVNAGVGVETWKIMAKTNKETLRALGMPEEVIAQMPASGLLSEQLSKLSDTVKKEFQLNTQLDRLTSLQTQGLTLTNDVKSYIRGKDEYLGEIEKMLDDTIELSAHMDLSNPHIAKRMGNYTTYLTMLKGRQTQRYMGFVNDSIDYYNQQVSAAQSLYESSANMAKEAYDKDAAMTTESYNMIDTMLGDMYTSAENKTENAREEIRWGYEQVGLEAQRVADVLKNKESVDKLEGTVVDYDKVPTPDNYAKFHLGVTEDEFGNMEFETYDPYEVKARVTRNNLPPQDGWDKFLAYSAKNVRDKAMAGTFTDEINKYKNVFIDYISNATEEEDYNNFVDGWFKMKKSLSGATFEGIKEYISGMDDKTEKIKNAMKSLTGEARFNKPKTIEDRASFINKQRSNIGDLAPALFDSYIRQVEAGSPPEETFSALYNLSDKDFASTLASDLSNSILTL